MRAAIKPEIPARGKENLRDETHAGRGGSLREPQLELECGRPHHMTIFEYETTLWVPRSRDEVFPFFAEVGNLQAITPTWLDFHVLTPDVKIAAGALIDYRLRVHGLPVRWRTHIKVWEPPFRFIDEQVRGPFRLWHHEHAFELADEGTLCQDRVRYALWGGRLIHWLLVRRDVERIFAHRRECLRRRFSPL